MSKLDLTAYRISFILSPDPLERAKVANSLVMVTVTDPQTGQSEEQFYWDGKRDGNIKFFAQSKPPAVTGPDGEPVLKTTLHLDIDGERYVFTTGSDELPWVRGRYVHLYVVGAPVLELLQAG